MDIRKRYDAFDRYQQRRGWLGFPIAVGRKYSEDQGSYLAATITYYGFFAMFPLLLVATTLLGFILPGHEHLQRSIVNSELGQFPVIGQELRLHRLHGSGIALTLGIVVSLWSGMGVFVAAENAMSRIWEIPFNRRPSSIRQRGRALMLLFVLGAGAIGTTTLSGVGAFAGSSGVVWKVAAAALSLALNIGLFWVAFRVLTAGEASWRSHRGGAVAAAVAWQALQAVGGFYVGHVVRHASDVYGAFAGVIGLLSFIYLSAHVTLLAAEANVVATRRLWPRSLGRLGRRPPTDADRRALTQLAQEEERRPGEQVEVEIPPPTSRPGST